MALKALKAPASKNWCIIPERVVGALPKDVFLCDVEGSDADGTHVMPDPHAAKTIGVVHEASAEKVIDTVLNYGFRHVVQIETSVQNFLQEVEVSSALITKPHEFFTNPAATILGSMPKESYSLKFDSYAEKTPALDELANFLRLVPRTSTVATSALTIADEFFTNALLNAPGNRRALSPAELKNVKIAKPAEIFLATDYFRLVIGCRDSYGSLDMQKVMLRLKETFTLGIGGAIRNNPATGAGIGLRTVFDLSQSLHLGVREKTESIVCCVLPLRQSMKENAMASKNVHLIKP